jgi:ATPase subunit of ABC transporter with duplicated ATPase domains
MGTEKADAGTLQIGETVQISYVDQSRDELDAKKTVYQEISGGYDLLEVGSAKIHARAYCGRFNFKGSDQQKFVGDLSGENVTAFISRSCCDPVATCCCSTNPQTISTWILCEPWKKVWRTSAVVR